MKILEIRSDEKIVRIRKFSNKRSDLTVRVIENDVDYPETSCINCDFVNLNCSSDLSHLYMCNEIRSKLNLEYPIRFEIIRV